MNGIDKASRTPLYLQLIDKLINKIENYMEEDDRLPSEREICEIYSLSRPTVRQALDALERDGYIYKVHGKGTFVAPKKFNQDLVEFYSFTEEMKKIGKIPKSEVVGFEMIAANSIISEKLRITEGDLVYKLTRIRKADNVPMLFEVSYLPYNRFKNLTKKVLEERAMYEIFKEDFNVVMTSAEEYFKPVLTNKLESHYLNIVEGSPSLKIERFTFERNSIIEYTVSIARGDKFTYRVRLNNTL